MVEFSNMPLKPSSTPCRRLEDLPYSVCVHSCDAICCLKQEHDFEFVRVASPTTNRNLRPVLFVKSKYMYVLKKAVSFDDASRTFTVDLAAALDL